MYLKELELYIYSKEELLTSGNLKIDNFGFLD